MSTYFFENNVGKADTVNSFRYREIITDFFGLLNKFFFRITSRNYDINWSTKSCDLTTLYLLLSLGYVPSQILTNNSQ